MSYDICFKVKVQDIDRYISVGECSANITWNVGKMIRESTGLEWKNEENNGLCKDVIPHIAHAYRELSKYPERYKKYESPNGWGTIEGCRRFFMTIMDDWDDFCEEYPDLIDVTYFWIV